MTEETRQLIIKLFNAEHRTEYRKKRLEFLSAFLKSHEAEIKAKVKRIAELQVEVDLLNRKIEELQQELKIKDMIIKKQAIRLVRSR